MQAKAAAGRGDPDRVPAFFEGLKLVFLEKTGGVKGGCNPNQTPCKNIIDEKGSSRQL